jgi:hypothetical protein
MPLARPYNPMAAVPSPSGRVAAWSYDRLSGICRLCYNRSEATDYEYEFYLCSEVNDSNAVLLECRKVIVVESTMEESARLMITSVFGRFKN